MPDILERYQPDSIRYFLIANGPEKRDTDFSWREFIYSHNGELLGAFGNFVNRTLAFVQKSFGGSVPAGAFSTEWRTSTEELYHGAGALVEAGQFKDALELIFGYVRRANKYFDERKPWAQFKENRAACENTLYECVQIIANLANLLEPFTPFACAKIRKFLTLEEPGWTLLVIPAGRCIRELELLFERIDPDRIAEEEARLERQLRQA